jgi:hypothetical protein
LGLGISNVYNSKSAKNKINIGCLFSGIISNLLQKKRYIFLEKLSLSGNAGTRKEIPITLEYGNSQSIIGKKNSSEKEKFEGTSNIKK